MSRASLAPHTEPAVLALLETAAALQRRLDRALSHARGVSFSEYRLLATLADAKPGHLRRTDLAGAVGLTASAVTRALKPLEKLGYVTTERNARDARQSLAAITPAGRELLRDARAVLRDELFECPLNALAEDEVAAFRQRLDHLAHFA